MKYYKVDSIDLEILRQEIFGQKQNYFGNYFENYYKIWIELEERILLNFYFLLKTVDRWGRTYYGSVFSELLRNLKWIEFGTTT